MKDIAIYGAGGLGKEVYFLIQRLNKISPMWNVVGFFDDNLEKGSYNGYGKILGGISDVNSWSSELALSIAVGQGTIVRKIYEQISNSNIYYPSLLDNPIIWDVDTLKFGKGNIVIQGCTFSCNVQIGDFNLLNGDITIGHDNTIGDFNTIMPAVRISGECSIGNENFFGVGSIVIPQIQIPNKITLGAGSVLMTKPKSGNVYIGVPAKLFRFS